MAGNSKYTGLGVALGAIAGTVFGVATGHIAIWLAIGIPIGVAIGASLRRKGSNCPQCELAHQHHTTKALTK